MSPITLFPRKLEGLKGMSWMAEVELNHLVHLTTFKNSMLEIGTASGATSGYVSRKNPNVEIICVDNFGKGNEYDAERLSNWKENATDRMNLINADSSTLRDRLSSDTTKFDLVLIDGDHNYEGCLRDLSIVVPYCVPGLTTIVCHDYGDPNHRGVQLAVHEFVYRFPEFRFINIQHSLVELFYEVVR